MDQKQQFKRQTAKKLKLVNLTSGKFEEKEGQKILITEYGEEIGRIRILATVVSRFVSEDKEFASVTLDDGTDTIRVKGWKDTKNLQGLNVGDIIDLIGKVREYNGETYLTNEIVQKIDDPNLELLRKLELLQKMKSQGIKKKAEVSQPVTKLDSLRDQILKMIEENKTGIEYTKILKAVKAKTEDTEAVIDDLLSGGICYEPNPGVIKKI